jgi:hypothetical protein
MADKTWLTSIWRHRYQKHAPVTSSLTATNASLFAPLPRGEFVVSISLAALLLIEPLPI